MSDSPQTPTAAPLLGADNSAVYGAVLGYSDEEIAALEAEKAI
jgi:hypothetical protein